MQGKPSHSIKTFLRSEKDKRSALSSGYVATDPLRCVQCGICSYNCPINIDVRRYAWQGKPIYDSHCLTCGECVARCPRSALSFAPGKDYQPGRSGIR